MSSTYTANLTDRLTVLLTLSLLVLAVACSESSGDDNGGDNNGRDVVDDSGRDTDGADASSGTPLVSPHSWAAIPASEDPVADAPDTAMCDVDNGTKTEEFSGETAFGVSTQACPYIAVSQTTLAPIAQGDTVFVRAWHFELTAPEDTEAHLAVALDGETIWEERVAIPSEQGGLLTSEWTATRDIPLGSQVVFHAHNHGNNEYYLLEITRK